MKRFLILLLCALTGCQTVHLGPQNPAGKTLVGQMFYSSPKRSFVGDFTARASASDFFLDVSKGPAPLLSVRESGEFARMEGGGHAWHGSVKKFVPPPVRTWLTLRGPLYISAQTQTNTVRNFSINESNALFAFGRDLTLAGQVKLQSANGAASKLELDFTGTHEHFIFQFSK